MKKISVLFFLSLAGIILVQCSQAPYPTADQIVVTWKLVSNNYSDKAQSKSVFTFENKSKLTLNASNWAMFYNQSPREIINCEGNTTLTRLSGDWYKLAPAENFILKPGEKCEITYEAEAFWIKEIDAPLGPYFVFFDKNGKETSITTITNYTIEPFTEPDQINRFKNDQEPIPTAAFRYLQNQKMSEVTDNLLPVIIPTPVLVKFTGKMIQFDAAPEILYEKGLENEAQYIAGFVSKIAQSNVAHKEATAPKANCIYLGIKVLTVNGISKEAYTININADKSIVLSGSDAAGVFYAIQSLVGLIPPTLFAGAQSAATIPEIVIEDAPRFPFRSLHIDVSRNFQSKETMKKMIDLMAFYKLNYMQLYLSEDEGWRIAINGLPELTEVASRRGHTIKESTDMLHPSYGSGPFADAPENYGTGFYSRDDYKELLKYAQARKVSIIPTINFPGHSRAAIRAMEARHEKFMKDGNAEKANEFRLIDPDDKSKYKSAQAYNDNIVCVALGSVYHFYETVIDDIIAMHQEAGVPLEFFHTGGDEVPEGVWTESPLCKKLMETMPEFKDPKNLQSYFLRQTVEILQRKNLKIGGWEEVAMIKDASGKYIPNPEFVGKNVYPWVWNNMGQWADLTYRLANAGYPVVMCNVTNFYFDLAYNKDPQEPGLYWGGFVDTRNAWEFAPYNSFITNLKTTMGQPVDPSVKYKDLERLKPGNEKNIVGLQAQLWGETIKGSKMLEYYALPKLIGFAETAWAKAREWENQPNAVKRTQQMDESWNIFANALAKKELPRLSGLFGGFNYRIPQPGAVIEDGLLNANVELPGLKIRYTTDGSEPDSKSALYSEPVKVSGTVQLKAFDLAGRSSRSVVLK